MKIWENTKDFTIHLIPNKYFLMTNVYTQLSQINKREDSRKINFSMRYFLCLRYYIDCCCFANEGRLNL